MDGNKQLRKSLDMIDARTDSREILSHARQQADARDFDDVFIVCLLYTSPSPRD